MEQQGDQSTVEDGQHRIALGEKFSSFDSLKDAIDLYQRENGIQLIVKDSKLLSCIGKKMPKLMEHVNKEILYYRLIYACEFHGEFKNRGKTRPNHVTKRRGCPMSILIRLAEDLNHLVIYELYREHNHPIVPKKSIRTPQQHTIRLSRTNPSNYLLQSVAPGSQASMLETEAIEDFQNTINTPHSAKTTPLLNNNGTNSNKRTFLYSDLNSNESESQTTSFRFGELKKQRMVLQNKKLELETRKLQLENKKLELELKALEKKQQREEESQAVQNSSNTYYVSHMIEDSKDGITDNVNVNTFPDAATAQVLKSLAGQGQSLQIITHP